MNQGTVRQIASGQRGMDLGSESLSEDAIASLQGSNLTHELNISTAKKQKPEKVKLVAPDDMPRPRRGTSWCLYCINRAIGRPDLVPKLRGKDKLEYETRYLEKELRFLAQHLKLTISFVNIKGGASKTTTAVYIGNMIAEVTDLNVWLLPATQSAATSTTALNAGIPQGETLTASQFAEMYEQLGDYRSVSPFVPATKHGLRVISEDSDETISINNGFNKEKFEKVVDTLHQSVDFLLFDTGNDDVAPDSVVLEAVRRSDVIIFTASVQVLTTLEKLAPSIGLYMTDLKNQGNIDVSPDYIRSEKEIPTAEKASRSLVMISNTSRKQTPEDFTIYTRRRDQDGRDKGSMGFYGKILTVPHDKYIANNLVSDLDKIDQRTTRLAYLQHTVEAFRVAAQLKGFRYDVRYVNGGQPRFEVDASSTISQDASASS